MEDGDTTAVDRLLPHVYEDLRRVADQVFKGQWRNHTLQPTALVHEAYLRLVSGQERHFENRLHFFSAAAEAMRRILVDHARRKRRLKRGGGGTRRPLQDLPDTTSEIDLDVLALDEALNRLDAFDARKAHVVKLRYFLGLTIPETAELLGVVPRTIDLDWRLAKAWLRKELQG